jgi:DNA-binding transcriptional MocR family regulator
MFSASLSTQLSLRPGILELYWGQPDPRLLPIEAVREAATRVFTQHGMEVLSYGKEAGPAALLDWIRQRVQHNEGQELPPGETVVTAGNSDGLDQVCTLFTRAGDVALVESPAYHLAIAILRDHQLELEPVPVDEGGLRVDVLAETLRALKRAGRNPRLLYTIPTFQNPTGSCMAASRRRALIELAAAESLLIVEDDVYRELAYDGPAPPSLWSEAPRGVVLRLGSFAKSLAPGLRLGWLNGSVEQVARITGCGLRASGGGVNHATAMVIGEFCAGGAFEPQLERFRAAYGARRDALDAALGRHLPDGCRWTRPGGGYFIWVALPAGMDARELLPVAERHGVAFTPGTRFHHDGGGAGALRLAFSLYTPDELEEAAQRLGSAIRAL